MRIRKRENEEDELLNYSEFVKRQVKGAQVADQELKKLPEELRNFFERGVEAQLSDVFNKQHTVGDFVKRMYSSVSPNLIYPLARIFYGLHSPEHFTPDLETRVSKAIKQQERHYPHQLNAKERAFFTALRSEPQKGAFRIVRDLAHGDDPTTSTMEFFMSANHLAARLEIRPVEAYRILAQFRTWGALQVVKPGKRRARGQQGVATCYLWKLARAKKPPQRKPSDDPTVKELLLGPDFR